MKERESSASDALGIDALYGLEPVWEPSADEGGALDSALQFQSVQCPYCGENFEALLDLSAGCTTYIEDCQICCQPIEFAIVVDHSGSLRTLAASRSG